jgi:hypothetical protein
MWHAGGTVEKKAREKNRHKVVELEPLWRVVASRKRAGRPSPTNSQKPGQHVSH